MRSCTALPLAKNAAAPTNKFPAVASADRRKCLSRRHFLRVGVAFVTGAALSACTPWNDAFLAPLDAQSSDGLPMPNREEIQIVYQDWRTDWFPDIVEELLAEFHEEHPNIRVFFTPDPDNLADAMLLDMQAGTAPDLFWGGSTFFPIWAQQGYLLDLRDYVAADLALATVVDWDPAQYRAFFLSNGQQFGLPKYHGAVALYYNKALFDAAGIDYPNAQWSYDDYWLAMQRLTHDTTDGARDQWGSMVDIAWDHLQIYVNGWGGHLVAPYDAAFCTADEPAATTALEWLRTRMWDEHIMAGFPDVQYMSPRSAFINQRVAMVEEGSWVLKEILRNSDFPVGVAPLPRGPVRRVTLATSDGFGIYRDTQYPEASWEFLKFLTSERFGLALAQADFLQPARASLIDQWMGFIREEFPEKAQNLDLTAFADGHLRGYSVTVEIADNMAEVEPQLTAAFEQIFTLGQAPVSMMHAVCAQINRTQRNGSGQRPRLAE